MTTVWPQVRLGDVVASISNGINRSVTRGKGEGPFRITRIETIASGEVDPSRVGRGILTDDEALRYRLNAGDILFSHINSLAHVGKSAIYLEDVGLIHGTNLLRIVAKPEVEPRFLHHVLVNLFRSGYWRGVANQAVNQASVNQRHLKDLLIPLPPLDEQKRIVARLDQVDRLSADLRMHTGQGQGLCRILEERVLTALLWRLEGMKSQALSSVADIQSGFAFKSVEYAKHGHFLMRIRNVQDGYLTLSEPVYVDLRKEPKLERFALAEGDVLVSLTGNIGRVGQVLPEHLPAALNQRVARVRARPDLVRPEFLLMVLRSPEFRDTLIDKGHGAAQANVSPKVLNDFPVPAISLSEQDAIVADYKRASEQIEALRSIHARQQDLIRELDASILQAALSGSR